MKDIRKAIDISHRRKQKWLKKKRHHQWFGPGIVEVFGLPGEHEYIYQRFYTKAAIIKIVTKNGRYRL